MPRLGTIFSVASVYSVVFFRPNAEAMDRLSQFNTLLSQEDPPLSITARQVRASLVCPYMITIRPLDDFDDLRIDFHGGGRDWGGSDKRLSDYHVEASATLDGGFDDATVYTY